jgi:hypothetical protein
MMPGMMENLSTINSFLRTLIGIVVLGGVGATGYFGYTTYNAKEREAKKQAQALAKAEETLADTKNLLSKAKAEVASKIAELETKNAEIVKLNENIDKLETAITLLKVDHRVARLTAVDQTTDFVNGEASTLIEFVELNDEGQPIDTPRQFRIRGDVVFLDNWIVKFDDKYVQDNDLERGTSLVLFRRIFGEMQQPIDGYPLDPVGSAPRAYARGSRMSDFERRIWDDFWSIANDPAEADKLGIRAAHGQAVSMKVQKGRSYKVQLRASDGLSIVPEIPQPTAPIERGA